MSLSRRSANLVRAGAALLFGAAWGWVCPLLAAIERGEARSLTPWLAVAGVVTGLLTTLRLRGGPAGGFAVAIRVGVGGALVAGIGVAALGKALGPSEALALALVGTGMAGTLAVGLGLWLGLSEDRNEQSTAAPLPSLLAAASGALALSAWALASGHILGQRQADATRHARAQARDLVAIVAGRDIVSNQIHELSAELSPPGGYLVSVENGVVSGGVGVGVPTGTPLAVTDEPYLCRTGARTLPCALRRLSDGSDVVAAVPVEAESGPLVLGFGIVGLFVALFAVGAGRLVGGAIARELDRVARTLDQLGRGLHGLDRPIIAASLDEVGDLAAALGRLRAHLRPTLAEYETALDRAQSADRARTDFLQLVSVELQQPLDQIVSGALALLDPASEKLTPEQAEDVKIVLSSSKHLCDLIEEVLDVSAIATGQVTLKTSDVDVGALVSDVAKAQRPLLQVKGVELKLEIGEPSPRARVDERRVRQVVTNIVSNAVKFTEKGFIAVRAHQAGGNVEIEVQDSGPGISSTSLPRLFSEFVQLGSLKQRAHGTGLGLAICKRLVEAHGGQVNATSEKGIGSVFKVTLPIGARAEAA